MVSYNLSQSDHRHGTWKKIFKAGHSCQQQYEELRCGRPLGLEFDRLGRLVVSDAYFGIHRVRACFSCPTSWKESLVLCA